MKQISIKPLLPHIAAIISIFIVCSIYFSPVYSGKKITQSDIINHKSQSQEIRDYLEKGETLLWTSRVFGGMSTFNIGAHFHTNILTPLRKFQLALPSGLNIAFVTCLGFYLLLIMLGVHPWLAIIGALAYGLSSNLLSSISAGHNSKVLSIAYFAPALGAIILTYRKKYLVGGFLTAFFVGQLVISNHYQIIYYFLLASILGGITYLVHAIRDKSLSEFAKSSIVLLIAGIIGFLPNFSKVYNTREHGKETIRGGQKLLSSKAESDVGGLDRNYAMSWSHGLMETFTIIIPSVKGGSSQEELPKDGAVSKLIGKQRRNTPLMGPTYIGDQPFLQGTIYFGAAFIFLFILSLFTVNEKYKPWLITIAILSFFIGWGRNFPLFSNFMFDYFPLYNKFRTPSMALALAGITIPLLGLLGLSKILDRSMSSETFKKGFRNALITSGGLMLLLLFYGLTSDWIGPNDTKLPKPWNAPQLYEALLIDRKSLFMSDWLLSVTIMAVIGGSIWLYQREKIKLPALLAVLLLAAVGDNWRVSKRYLNDSSFVTVKQFTNQFKANPSDQKLINDPDPHFRVINLTRNPWTDSKTCYHHENIGGHHAAKIQRYQDMIENHLGSQLSLINSAVVQGPNGLIMNPQVSAKMTAYNMLNCKYYVAQNDANGVVQNPTACGNAWFVSDIRKVSSHDEEMAAVGEFNPLQTAIVHEEFSDDLYDYTFANDQGSIALTDFSPQHISYTSTNGSDGLAVFSEVIYTNGWKALVDGKETPIYRVNYLLRAIKIPAGEHKIEMIFKPSSYEFGENVSLAGSILFVIFGLSVLFFQYKTSTKNQPTTYD